MESFFTTEIISALLTLTFLEIVLGIDNILFVSIIAGKLSTKDQKRATGIGLAMAMILRLILLLGISVLMSLQSTWIILDNRFIHADISGQSIILFLGGLFLLYKSTKEIYEKVELKVDEKNQPQGQSSLTKAIVQITLINLVFSLDSILTAMGMSNGLPYAGMVMGIAIVISILIMMLFAHPVGNFVNQHPSLQVLGLSFLLLIGFMLLAEAAHLSHAEILGQTVGSIPKGYLYFAIAFSLGVEFINMKVRRKPKQS
ncbi:MAG: TerC family protein [Flavobacteriaceae bacterium]|nr:TerC family protein [Flavobacteriaceae bacterium]MDB2521240.1 TerC family protein [Flavobacteriaceae bacterium]MDC0479370.1 TerC family protein [Flavobacteriaceae bacterium]